jgi:hypothetical protein
VGQTAVVVLADFHPAKARDVRLRLVVGRSICGPILPPTIDPTPSIAPVQQSVGVGLVGRDGRPRGNKARCQGADVGLVFPRDDERQGALAADPPGQIVRRIGLAHHRNTALVGVPMRGQTPIHPLLGLIGGAYRATDIAPVDLHFARQRRLVALVHEALTQLVHRHEGGLGLDVQIPAQVQRRQSLRRIGIDRDGPEVDLQRQLAVGEDGPGGDREGVPTVLAAPLAAAGQEPMSLDNPAGRTHRFPIAAPPHLAERLERPVVAHGEHLAHRPGSGRGRQEEVWVVHGPLRRRVDGASVHPRVAQIVSLPRKWLMQKSCAAAT